MQVWRATCLLVGSLVALTACGGGPAPTLIPTGVPTAIVTAAATAGSLASDVTVQLAPTMYPPGTVCAGVTTNTLLGALPAPCAFAWSSLGLTSIPSPGLMADAPMPTTALIAQPIPAAQGTAAATAFYRWQVLAAWAEIQNYPQFLTTIDGAFAPDDPVLALLTKGDNIATNGYPSCAYPNSLRVIQMTPAADNYLNGLGWDAPSQEAIVATFPTCPSGITAATGSGPVKIAASNKPFSQVITGSISTSAAFGALWQINGFATCGAPALASVCNP